VNTHFANLARIQQLTDEQLAIVVGSLLGDGYLAKTTSGYAFRVNHGLKQKDYVDWKYGKLENFANSSPKQSGSCYYFRTITHQTFVQLHTIFYPHGKKIISKQFLWETLDALVLAIWIMDDGSKDKGQLRINSQCFSLEEHELLQNVLRAKLGIETTLKRDKLQFRLRVAQSSMDRLRIVVLPYVIPSMLYKLIP